jgi:hypothetical protein
MPLLSASLRALMNVGVGEVRYQIPVRHLQCYGSGSVWIGFKAFAPDQNTDPVFIH